MASTIGERIKLLRTKAKMNQKDLADKIDVSKSTIGMYEQNRRMPDTETVMKLAVSFGVSTDYLLGKNAPENPQKKELFDIVNGMSDDELKQFKEYAEYLISRR